MRREREIKELEKKRRTDKGEPFVSLKMARQRMLRHYTRTGTMKFGVLPQQIRTTIADGYEAHILILRSSVDMSHAHYPF